MEFETIITNRLILRKITQEVFDFVYSEFSSEAQLEFLGLDTYADLEIEKTKYDSGLSTHNKRFLYFQLLEKTTSKIIGWCGYHTWYTDHSRAEIGYGLFMEELKGKGLMTEAMVPIIEYGFDDMALNRIEAFVSQTNIPSLKLMENWHFKNEGLLREHYRSNNRLEDSVVFALLRSEHKRV